MLKIRLQRIGRINEPSYRVVVTEHTNGPKSGRAVETLGFYNPKSKERKLDADRIIHWISKGAQPSGTMHNMLISAGITKGKKINVLPKKTVPKKDEPAAEAAPAAEAPAAEAPAETSEAASAEEVPAETSAQA
ncbi:30S ribosomal protein S16 [Candidatus Kaiserbacteria bacterium RIFCSPHIGHO2_01_FULL_56_24]|uniref:Small ribosomal subunit protein bS16 n=1 Tax=Candidatus Kaiserbacteria bacterium RIFCSPHIGHO2_01_FULL_56_24 TaxID=1798487 RepID=A0A1F6DAK9_9BACT|nr:MAG: 30S ribosomal protein S16 [Candidatus Kaiserbacteria bacterium RIFCSPHIGHO2_01_FULL_56_24]